MKKIFAIVLVALTLLGAATTTIAAELDDCVISVSNVAGAPGETVTVPIRIDDNPGFTNFAIALGYDQENLVLKSIQTHNGDIAYLCGSQVSANTQWEDEDGNSAGYVVAALSDAVKENGILFTATFEIQADFTGTAVVTPAVAYIRNNEALFSIFEVIGTTATSGTVISALVGDVNGDGMIEYDDVMLAYKGFLDKTALTAAQLTVVDTNENGIVDESEYQAIYQIYIGG